MIMIMIMIIQNILLISICFMQILPVSSHLDTISYHRGFLYSWAWLSSFVIATVGIILNSFVIRLYFITEVRDFTNNFHFNQIILFGNIFYLIEVVIRSILSYTSHSYYSSYHHTSSLCDFDNIVNTTFIIWNMMIFIGMANKARLYLVYGEVFHKQNIVIWTICSIAYAIIPSVVSLFNNSNSSNNNDNQSNLDSSGTYCLLSGGDTINISMMIVFMILLPFPLFFYNIYLIHEEIKESQSLLEKEGIEVQAKGGYGKTVSKLLYFVIGIISCLVVILCAGIYEYQTNTRPIPTLSAIGSLFVIANFSIFTPFLFIFFTPDVKHTFMEHYGYIFTYKIRCSSIVRFIIVKSLPSHKRRRRSIIPRDRKSQSIELEEDPINYDDWHVWLSDYRLRKVFHGYVKSIYAIENLLFYDDVMKYHDLTNLSLEPESYWIDLEVMVNRIYRLYIKVPKAPLEININSDTRERVLKRLYFNDSTVYNTVVPSTKYILNSPMASRNNENDINDNNNNNSSKKSSFVSGRVYSMSKRITPQTVNAANISGKVLRFQSNRSSNDSFDPSSGNAYKLNVNSSFMLQSINGDFVLPDLSKYSVEEKNRIVKEYVTIFDESLVTVSNIIQSDLWSKFRRNPIFELTKTEHRASHLFVPKV